MEKIPITELVSAYERELIKLGYTKNTLKYYRRCWQHLEEYFHSQGIEFYSYGTAMEYVRQVCGKDLTDYEAQLSASDIYLYRIVCSLTDFMESGVIRRKYVRRMTYRGSQENLQILDLFTRHQEVQGLADSTVKSARRTAERFMSCMEADGIVLGKLNAAYLQKYFISLSGYAKKTLEAITYSLRSYLSFLYQHGDTALDLSGCVPVVKAVSQASIPSVWEESEYASLLEHVDRSNAIGRRDYAILLLAGKLGIRSIDIKQLTFSCINWVKKEVSFVQAKTGCTVVLPLTEDVGWAIIDYIRNGRPVSNCEYIFLRHTAPIGPLVKDNHLYYVVKKYAAKAGLERVGKHSGLHSLRHTLATELMESHVPIQEISNIMGHRNTDTTGIYLKTSVDLLRACAQEVEHGV